MYKVLLADDNRFALNYFSHLIDWQKAGYTLVGAEADGEFAWQRFQMTRPDVIITDIQMPNMDGIELSRRVLETAPDTVIVFLSSYEEFRYARSAVQLGIYDYIIKHELTAETLLEKLDAIRQILAEKHSDNRYIEEGRLSLLLNEVMTLPQVNYSAYDQDFPGKYTCCIFMQDHIFPEMYPLCKELPEEIPENEIKTFLYEFDEMRVALRTDPFIYVLMLEPDRSFFEIAESMRFLFQSRLGTTATLILAAENCTLRHCFSEYARIYTNLKQKYFYLPSSVLYPQNFYLASPHATNTPYGNHSFPEHTFRNEENAAELSGNVSGTMLKLSEKQDFSGIYRLLEQGLIAAVMGKTYGQFQELTHTAVSILCSFYKKKGSFTFYRNQLTPLQQVTYWCDASSITQWLLNQFSELDHRQSQISDGKYSHLVQEVLFYIYQNYANPDLSVESIADSFHVNMNQLNYVFKKETATTVIRKITQVRMENATQLLEDRTMQISEICNHCGYKSISYFSNAFKKYYGQSPQDYRKHQGYYEK